MKVEYNHLLLRMAKLLVQYAPDECITSISISKTESGLKFMPELHISHFARVITPGTREFIRGATETVDGVEVALSYFEERNKDA